MPRYFLDTNIVFYTLIDDPRALVAQALVAGDFAISAQVLNELAHSTRRKLGKDWAEIANKSADLAFAAQQVVVLSGQLHLTGLELVQRYSLSIYDALIIAAALEAGCDTLYSEDMQDGLVVDGRLTIRNPFAETAAA